MGRWKNFCTLCGQTGGNHVAFHRFPAHPETRLLWMKICNMDTKDVPRPSVVICSNHFTTEDYITAIAGVSRLKFGAHPSISVPNPVNIVKLNTIEVTPAHIEGYPEIKKEGISVATVKSDIGEDVLVQRNLKLTPVQTKYNTYSEIRHVENSVNIIKAHSEEVFSQTHRRSDHDYLAIKSESENKISSDETNSDSSSDSERTWTAEESGDDCDSEIVCVSPRFKLSSNCSSHIKVTRIQTEGYSEIMNQESFGKIVDIKKDILTKTDINLPHTQFKDNNYAEIKNENSENLIELDTEEEVFTQPYRERNHSHREVNNGNKIFFEEMNSNCSSDSERTMTADECEPEILDVSPQDQLCKNCRCSKLIRGVDASKNSSAVYRYPGDLTNADLSSSDKAKRCLDVALASVKKYRKKITTLQQRNRRLVQKVEALKDLVKNFQKELNNKNNEKETDVHNQRMENS